MAIPIINGPFTGIYQLSYSGWTPSSIFFDASNTQWYLGPVLTLGVNNAFSVGFWVKKGHVTPTNPPYDVNNPYSEMVITQYDQTPASPKRTWGIQINVDPISLTQTYFAYVFDQAHSAYLGKKSMGWPQDEWHFLMLTYNGLADASASVQFYINGVAQTTNFNAGTFQSISNTGANLKVGSYTSSGGGGGARNYYGNMDELGIWNVCLTPEAVAFLFSTGMPMDITQPSPQMPGPITYYTPDNANANLSYWWRFKPQIGDYYDHIFNRGGDGITPMVLQGQNMLPSSFVVDRPFRRVG